MKQNPDTGQFPLGVWVDSVGGCVSRWGPCVFVWVGGVAGWVSRWGSCVCVRALFGGLFYVAFSQVLFDIPVQG